jgi:hypothetical protein
MAFFAVVTGTRRGRDASQTEFVVVLLHHDKQDIYDETARRPLCLSRSVNENHIPLPQFRILHVSSSLNRPTAAQTTP